MPVLDAEDVEDLEEAPDNEVEAAEEEILDQATAARTIVELKAEIETLKGWKRLPSPSVVAARIPNGVSWRACWAKSSLPTALVDRAAEPDAYPATHVVPPKPSPPVRSL